MKDRSDDPSHHERTLLPRSYREREKKKESKREGERQGLAFERERDREREREGGGGDGILTIAMEQVVSVRIF